MTCTLDVRLVATDRRSPHHDCYVNFRFIERVGVHPHCMAVRFDISRLLPASCLKRLMEGILLHLRLLGQESGLRSWIDRDGLSVYGHY